MSAEHLQNCSFLCVMFFSISLPLPFKATSHRYFGICTVLQSASQFLKIFASVRTQYFKKQMKTIPCVAFWKFTVAQSS